MLQPTAVDNVPSCIRTRVLRCTFAILGKVSMRCPDGWRSRTLHSIGPQISSHTPGFAVKSGLGASAQLILEFRKLHSSCGHCGELWWVRGHQQPHLMMSDARVVG